MIPPVPHEPHPRRPQIVEAFLQDFNLIALGGVAALAALADSSLVLLAGGAAEALYLVAAPGSAWFQRYQGLQRARRRTARRMAWRRRSFWQLPRAAREQFRAVWKRLDAALAVLDLDTARVARGEVERVEDLLDQFLVLLAVRAGASRYLAMIDQRALAAQFRDASARVRAIRDDPEVARVEEQRLRILQKRLTEQPRLERALQVVAAQIATLEHGIGYLADKLVSWSAEGREPLGLQDIIAGIEGIEQALERVRPLVRQIARASGVPPVAGRDARLRQPGG